MINMLSQSGTGGITLETVSGYKAPNSMPIPRTDPLCDLVKFYELAKRGRVSYDAFRAQPGDPMRFVAE